MKSLRKYDRGVLPCGNCNLGQHQACRPRLDGMLCTCTCDRAEWEKEVRASFENNQNKELTIV